MISFLMLIGLAQGFPNDRVIEDLFPSLRVNSMQVTESILLFGQLGPPMSGVQQAATLSLDIGSGDVQWILTYS